MHNFMSIPFDNLLISWVTNYVSNQDPIDRELHSLKCIDLKLGLSSELSKFFDKKFLFGSLRLSAALFVKFLHEIMLKANFRSEVFLTYGMSRNRIN